MILLALLGWTVRGPDGVPTERDIEPASVLARATLDVPVADPGPALARVATDTARFLRAHPEDPASKGALPAEVGIDPARRLRTLDRLSEGAFTLEDFDVFSWTADAAGLRKAKLRVSPEIRLTKYLVYESPGSLEKTETFDTALYAVPADPELVKSSRQAVFAGLYEAGEHAGKAEPLVWMSRRDVNRAIMQGTVAVQLAGGGTRVLNVHVSNDSPYDRSIRDSNKQARYWYFREVEGYRGYGVGDDKVRIEPGVTVAGDVYGLGLGTVVLLWDGQVGRVVVIGDTGGAFQPNLYQLDYFAGPFATHEAFVVGTKALPTYTEAYILAVR